MPRPHRLRLCFHAIGFFVALLCFSSGPAIGQEVPADLERGRALCMIERSVPVPLPNHPGNVFLADETLRVPVPKALPPSAKGWRILDDAGKVVSRGAIPAGETVVDAGKPGVGWYRVEFLDEQGKAAAWTTAAVLQRLAEATPQDSPICIDSATAWFARDKAEKQEAFVQFAALAGVNWIRDRMTWGAIETARGTFAEATTTYDTSAQLSAQYGLKALQVLHGTPKWARIGEQDGEHPGKRFPRDLRDIHNFFKAMAGRFRGTLLAWEPWNEANITHFGGHTIDEMCALQKAAYLGFKAGNPERIVCWNVFAGPGGDLQSEGVIANEAWPYFDTYNIHTYGVPPKYLSSFENARNAASGRPLWLSECGVRIPFIEDSPGGEFTRADDFKQAEFIAHSYACSMYAGVDRHFFFILGNYLERGIQFGLLRSDMTPRPGYVAFSALGRLLAGAKCIGRIEEEGDSKTHVYAFRAWPDGKERDVLVAWSDETADWRLSKKVQVEAVYDYLGRRVGEEPPKTLGAASLFIVLPRGELDKLGLESPPTLAAYREGKPSPIVMQVSAPQATARLAKQAHGVAPDQEATLPLVLYNFGDAPVSGRIAVEGKPKDWRVDVEADAITLAPSERKKLVLRATLPGDSKDTQEGGWIKLRGDFGPAGKPVLAFRLMEAAAD